MPNKRVLGKNSTVFAQLYDFDGETLLGSPLELTYSLRGFDGIEINEVEDTVEVTGGGDDSAQQRAGYIEVTGSFQIDDNAETRDLFFGNFNRRYKIWAFPEGDADAVPPPPSDAERIQFDAFTSSMTHDHAQRGKVRFNVNTLDCDGLASYDNVLTRPT